MANVENNFDPNKSTQLDETISQLKRALEGKLESSANSLVRTLSRASAEYNQVRMQLEAVNKQIENAGENTEELINLQEALKQQELDLTDKMATSRQVLQDKYDISTNALDVEMARLQLEDEIDQKLEAINIKKQAALSNDKLSTEEKLQQLRILENQEKVERSKQDNLDPTKRATKQLNAVGGEDSPLGSLISKLTGVNATSAVAASGGVGSAIAEGLSSKFPGLGSITGILEGIGGNIFKGLDGIVDIGATTKLIMQGLSALRKAMTQSINNAAADIQSYFGRIQANLENSGIDYYKIADDVGEVLGFSRFVKQTDYLHQISDLTNQGLVTDVEQRALLETIKNKTLTSFDVSNAALTRLVRLGEQSSINQFGLEYQLKRMLNSPVFGDASYLQGLFDSVTSAILDASVVGAGDITSFNSTVQTWLGAMYASGLSDNVVSSIASAINALGSGNVNALANDESMQRLFLLSMDRIGMDYADILQQGLSSEDTHKLLSAVVELLNEIAGNTQDNLVLKSSYSSLFNLSVSDMQAIQNVYSKMDTISSNIINSSGAQQNTAYAVSKLVEENTFVSEKWDNFFENFKYSFGSNIANNDALYNTYKIADITYEILDKFSGVGGALGKTVDALKLVPALTQFAIGGISAVKMISNATSASSGNLMDLLGMTNTGLAGEAMTGTYTSSSTSTSTSAFKTFKSSVTDVVSASQSDTTGLDQEEEDEVLGVLKELSKTLMKLKEGSGYAFAVSVEGMNTEVLRSFASIFADEDAMLATFTGDNNVLTDALFNYMDDTTSNSTEASSHTAGA